MTPECTREKSNEINHSPDYLFCRPAHELVGVTSSGSAPEANEQRQCVVVRVVVMVVGVVGAVGVTVAVVVVLVLVLVLGRVFVRERSPESARRGESLHGPYRVKMSFKLSSSLYK